jgi:hypothetical protein
VPTCSTVFSGAAAGSHKKPVVKGFPSPNSSSAFATMDFDKQPQPIPAMTVIGNRNPLNVPIEQDGRRDWSNGLCDCFGAYGTCA